MRCAAGRTWKPRNKFNGARYIEPAAYDKVKGYYQKNFYMISDYITIHFFYSRAIRLLKFNSLVLFDIVNQSIMVRTPQHPAVSSFKIPMPVSPSINLSTPKPPRKSENKRRVVGFFSSMVEIIANFSSSILLSFSFRYIIFSAGKNFWLVITYISTFCCSIILPPNIQYMNIIFLFFMIVKHIL